MGRRKLIQNVFTPPKSNVQFTEGQKSKGILDDYAQRVVVDAQVIKAKDIIATNLRVINISGASGGYPVFYDDPTFTGPIVWFDKATQDRYVLAFDEPGAALYPRIDGIGQNLGTSERPFTQIYASKFANPSSPVNISGGLIVTGGGNVDCSVGILSGANLTVSGAVATGTGTFGGLVVDSPTLVVDSVNNRVGINTAAPVSPLHIYSTTFPVTTHQRQVTATYGIYGGSRLIRTHATGLADTAGVAFYFGLDDSGGILRHAGSFGSKWTDVANKKMMMFFNTADNGADPSTGTERMTIDGTGNVSILTGNLDISGALTVAENISGASLLIAGGISGASVYSSGSSTTGGTLDVGSTITAGSDISTSYDVSCGTLTVGSTTLTEQNLIDLLALL